MDYSVDFPGFLRKLSPKLRAICFRLNRGFSSLDEQDLYQGALLERGVMSGDHL